MNEEKLAERRAELDEEWCEIVPIDSNCIASRICTKYTDFTPGPQSGTFIQGGPLGDFRFIAHIESERQQTDFYNESTNNFTIQYLYATTYQVTNPDPENDMKYNVVYKNEDVSVAHFDENDDKRVISPGETKSRAGRGTDVLPSQTIYTTICLEFEPPVDGHEKMCAPITEYSGGATTIDLPGQDADANTPGNNQSSGPINPEGSCVIAGGCN